MATLDAMRMPRHFRRRCAFAAAGALLLALTVTACGAKEAVDEGPFVYDAGLPLATSDRGVVDNDYPIAVHDISYAAGDDTVDAFLVVPPGKARRAAVVYVHGAGSTRDSMIGPALWLAAHGAVTLAITAPSSAATAPAVSGILDRLAWHKSLEIRDVVAVRRAVDLLSARDDVDPKRIGYVGWSAGARTGALLSGVEPRFHSLVLISGGSAPVSEFVQAAPTELRPQVEKTMSSIDPLHYIAQARPGSLLLEDGRRDGVIPRTALQALIDAAPRGTKVLWYDAGHALGPVAYRVHMRWLGEQLGINGPLVPGAKSEP
jgi:dienelactone hydrolase